MIARSNSCRFSTARLPPEFNARERRQIVHTPGWTIDVERKVIVACFPFQPQPCNIRIKVTVFPVHYKLQRVVFLTAPVPAWVRNVVVGMLIAVAVASSPHSAVAIEI